MNPKKPPEKKKPTKVLRPRRKRKLKLVDGWNKWANGVGSWQSA